MNLVFWYLTDSAVLGIVRTTNSIVKFDSSASSKIVPRLENFAGYGPSKKPNAVKKKQRILAASDQQETFKCK